MKRTFEVIMLASLSSFVLNAYAGRYIGFNVGSNYTSINKDINYSSTKRTDSDKYTGLRGQVLFGYDFHVFSEPTNLFLDELDRSENVGSLQGHTVDKGKKARGKKYKYQSSEYYLAIEAAGNYNGNNSSDYVRPWFLTTDAETREELKYGVDLFALFKYRPVPNSVFFVGPGLSVGKFEVSTPGQTAGNLGVTGSFGQGLLGWSVKAGMQLNTSKMYGIVLTYQYSNYNRITWSAVEPLTSEVVRASYKPVIHSITIGINIPLGGEPAKFNNLNVTRSAMNQENIFAD